MMPRILTAAALALLASITPAGAQGCGEQNPNCVVPTRPAGDSTKAAASTEFVTNALDGIPPTPTRAGDLIYWNGSAWTNLPGNNSGMMFLQETSSGVPSWSTPSSSGQLVSVVTYSSTQTITIPSGATKAFVRMWGGTGGSGGTQGGSDVAAAAGATGAGAYLEKYLTGLTAGLTLAYTQGGAGAAGTNGPGNGGNGGASTLVSGTQSISTLTAGGSNGSSAASGGGAFSAGTAGGTASGGDVNITGMSGQNGAIAADALLSTSGTNVSVPGSTMFSVGAYGNGTISATAGNAGNSGGLVIYWFS